MTIRRIDRDGYVRDVEGYLCNGAPAYLHLADKDDLSGQHLTYPTGYHPDCSWCWLNAPHSENAHHVAVQS